MSKRKERRVDSKSMIFFGYGEKFFRGEIVNLSPQGLAISSQTIFSPQTHLHLIFKPKEEQFHLDGVVMWSLRRELSVERFSRMGVRLMEPNAAYVRFAEDLVGSQSGVRREPRVLKSFRIAFSSPDEVVQAYTVNISRNGMFIQTESLLEIGSQLDVEMDLTDENVRLHFEAQVIFVIDPKTAAEQGREPGMGVRIRRFYDEDRSLFLNYVERFFVPED